MANKTVSRKNKILDTAEALFAQNGFVSTTMISVAEKSGFDLPSVNYHYRNKNMLLEAVLGRRVDVINEDRMLLLDRARQKSGNKPPDISAVLEALIYPFVRRCIEGDQQWINYTQVVSQIYLNRNLVHEIHKMFDPVAQHFISAMRMAVPNASLEKTLWNYNFIIGALMSSLSMTGRIESLSDGRFRSDDFATAYKHLIEFLVLGIGQTSQEQNTLGLAKDGG